jgi:endonuclease/exonuclease/phosphatase (EEP) superfamily protein YafD
VFFMEEESMALFAMLWAVWPLVGVGLAVGVSIALNSPLFGVLVVLLFVGVHGILPISDRLTSRAHKGAERVLALNLNVQNPQTQEIMETLPNKGLEIIGLTEVSTPVRQAWRRAFINRAYFVAMRVVNNEETLLLASRYPIVKTQSIADKQALWATLRQWDGTEINVVLLHAQAPTSRAKLARNLRVYEDLVKLPRNGPVIIMGDFNTTTLSRKLWQTKRQQQLEHASAWLAGTWPAGFNFLGFSVGSLLPLLPLDHILTRQIKVEASKRVYFPGTDHLGQLVTLRW